MNFFVCGQNQQKQILCDSLTHSFWIIAETPSSWGGGCLAGNSRFMKDFLKVLWPLFTQLQPAAGLIPQPVHLNYTQNSWRPPQTWYGFTCWGKHAFRQLLLPLLFYSCGWCETMDIWMRSEGREIFTQTINTPKMGTRRRRKPWEEASVFPKITKKKQLSIPFSTKPACKQTVIDCRIRRKTAADEMFDRADDV